MVDERFDVFGVLFHFFHHDDEGVFITELTIGYIDIYFGFALFVRDRKCSLGIDFLRIRSTYAGNLRIISRILSPDMYLKNRTLSRTDTLNSRVKVLIAFEFIGNRCVPNMIGMVVDESPLVDPRRR